MNSSTTSFLFVSYFNINYNTTSAVNARLLVNRDMVKHFEALGLLKTPVMLLLYQPTSQLLH